MEFLAFIIPMSAIATQLVKPLVSEKYYPHVATTIGLIMGVAFGAYYGEDLFSSAFNGAVYGAAAAGLYDVGKSHIG